MSEESQPAPAKTHIYSKLRLLPLELLLILIFWYFSSDLLVTACLITLYTVITGTGEFYVRYEIVGDVLKAKRYLTKAEELKRVEVGLIRFKRFALTGSGRNRGFHLNSLVITAPSLFEKIVIPRSGISKPFKSALREWVGNVDSVTPEQMSFFFKESSLKDTEAQTGKRAERAIVAISLVCALLFIGYPTFAHLFVTGEAVTKSGDNKTQVIARIDKLVNDFDAKFGAAMKNGDYETAAAHLLADEGTSAAINQAAWDLARIYGNQPMGRGSKEQQVPRLSMDLAVNIYSLVESVSGCMEGNSECHKLWIERHYPSYLKALQAYRETK